MKLAGIEIMSADDIPSDYGRWLIHGEQGSGKTTLASTIAKAGKTLFIDLIGEKGVRSFAGAEYSKNIDVIRPDSVTALDDIFWELNAGRHDYVAVVIDSLTALQKMTMRYLLGHDETAVKEIKMGAKAAEFRTWGQSLDVMTDTATFWYGLADGDRERPMHVIMTAQTKISENELTGEITLIPDVQKGALSIIRATPDYVIYTDVEDDQDAVDDEGNVGIRHIVRFGNDPKYRTKARIGYAQRGKVPRILGRKRPVDLVTLSRVLGLGGVPAARKSGKTTTTATKEG